MPKTQFDAWVRGTAIAGALVGMVLKVTGHVIVDAWIGAVFALPIGMMIAMITVKYGPAIPDDVSPKIPWWRVCIYSLLFLGFGALAAGFISDSNRLKVQVARISELQIGEIDQIRIYKGPRDGEMLVVDDQDALTDFVESARDVRIAYTDRLDDDGQRIIDQIEQRVGLEFVIVLTSGDEDEIAFSWSKNTDSTMLGYVVEWTSESRYDVRGMIMSKDLRKWYSEHLEGQIAAWRIKK